MAMGKIKNLTLYQQVYDATLKKAQRGELPTRLLLQNEVLFRGVPRERLHLVDGLVTSASAQEQIWVRDQHQDWNRFTGSSPDPKAEVTRGGCYFFQHEAAGIAEMRHYALQSPPGQLQLNLGKLPESIPHLLASKCILRVSLTAPKLLADLSLFSSQGDVSAMLRSLGLPPQAVSADDYSVSRALGHAMQAVPYLHGLIAQTARETERGSESGDNICLFGSDQAPVEGLRIESAYFFFPPGLLPFPDRSSAANEIVKVGIKQVVREPWQQLELGV